MQSYEDLLPGASPQLKNVGSLVVYRRPITRSRRVTHTSTSLQSSNAETRLLNLEHKNARSHAHTCADTEGHSARAREKERERERERGKAGEARTIPVVARLPDLAGRIKRCRKRPLRPVAVCDRVGIVFRPGEQERVGGVARAYLVSSHSILYMHMHMCTFVEYMHSVHIVCPDVVSHRCSTEPVQLPW